MNSLCFAVLPGKSTKCSPNPGLANEYSATPRGQLNWTGPIANSSEGAGKDRGAGKNGCAGRSAGTGAVPLEHRDKRACQRLCRHGGTPIFASTPASALLEFPALGQARRKSTKMNFLGPETAGWGSRLPREGVVVEKFVPALESLFSLGFEGGNLGSPGNFAGMSRTLGRVQKVCAKKVCAKKVCAHFSFPIEVLCQVAGISTLTFFSVFFRKKGKIRRP